MCYKSKKEYLLAHDWQVFLFFYLAPWGEFFIGVKRAYKAMTVGLSHVDATKSK